MTPYERGYAAGLKAAAALVPTDDTRELCCNRYDCECRKPEDAAFVAAEIEARRVKKAILSLPIQGEADQRGTAALQEVQRQAPGQTREEQPGTAGRGVGIGGGVAPAVTAQSDPKAPVSQSVPHPNPDEQVAENHKGAPDVRASARPGPCVMVPVEPTERILNAIAKQVNDCMMPKMIYQAMLAAAKEE